AITPGGSLLDVLRRPGGPLVELPATFTLEGRNRPLPPVNAQAMYRSIFHRRPLLNGYDGFWPAGFPERMALADQAPDPPAPAARRRDTGVELLLVHTDAFEPFPDGRCAGTAGIQRRNEDCAADRGAEARAAWLALADAGGRADLRLVGRDGPDLLF